MPENVIKIKDMYLLYSTVVDAPITWGMTKVQLMKMFKEERGNEGVRQLEKRLEKVELCGTSCILSKSAEDTVAGNHAGPDYSELTIEEIYTAYCLREPIRNGWLQKEAT